MRKVILHYHLFKNAGTSLDAAFKENFSEEKGEWVTKEFPNQPAANREQVRQWILDNPQAKCFSSHTMQFPVPEIEGVSIFPVIFFRHPIDRIASAYSFERKQDSNSFGATLAKNTDLAGYVKVRLSLQQDRQCKNFHTFNLLKKPCIATSEVEQARTTLNSMPFCGLVEKYDQSIKLLNTLLVEFGLDKVNLISKRHNVSRKVNKNLKEKLSQLEENLGSNLYNELIEANQDDLSLYSDISKRFE